MLVILRDENRIRKFIILMPSGIFKRRNLERSIKNFSILEKILGFKKKAIKFGWNIIALSYIKKRVKIELKSMKNPNERGQINTNREKESFESILDILRDNVGFAVLIRVKKSLEEKLELNLGFSTFIFIQNKEINKKQRIIGFRSLLRQIIFLIPSVLDINNLDAVDGIIELSKKKPTIISPRSRKTSNIMSILPRINLIIRAESNIIIDKLFFLLRWFFTLGQSSIVTEPEFDIKPEKSQGDIFIGEQIKNRRAITPFYLTSEDLCRHIVILGTSGSGKTRLARGIVEEVLKKYRTNIWILDFHGEYIDLALKNDFLVIAPASLYAPLALNIFDIVNEKIESYSAFLQNIIIESLRASDQPLSPQMERILSISLFETLRDVNIRNPMTFIYNLWKWSRRLNDTLPSAINSFHGIINRIRSFFVGATANVFWVLRSNIDVDFLLTRNVIFDFSFIVNKGILKRDLMLLHNVLLRYALSSIIKRKFHWSDHPRLLLVVEEAKYLVPWKRKENALDSSILEDLAVISRKYGLALCTISQTASSLSRDILENAGTYFFMSGGIDSLTQLESFQKILQYIQMLPPRHAIVKLTSIPSIIHIRVKHVEIQRIDSRAYIKILKNKGAFLREEYRPIPIPFETFISKVMQEKITEDEIYEITHNVLSRSNNVNLTKQMLLIKIGEKLNEIFENAKDKGVVIHGLLNDSRMLQFLISDIPDELLETIDLRTLSRMITDLIFGKINLLAGNIFEDRVQMLDAYYTTLEHIMKLLFRRKFI